MTDAFDRQSTHLPRGLIFLAALWLVGSWLLVMGVQRPVQPSSASFTPGLRVFLVCLAVGLMIAWPMLRLSQHDTPRPVLATLIDMLSLAALLQVVLWPMRLFTAWSIERTAAIDATLLSWFALIGAIVAAARLSSRAGPRNLAMLACLGVCLLGPALASLGVLSGVRAVQLVNLSPLLTPITLSGGGSAPPSDVHWHWIMLLATAGTACWLILFVMVGVRARHDSTT